MWKTHESWPMFLDVVNAALKGPCLAAQCKHVLYVQQ